MTWTLIDESRFASTKHRTGSRIVSHGSLLGGGEFREYGEHDERSALLRKEDYDDGRETRFFIWEDPK